MEFATIAAATQMDYNVKVLHIRLWAVLLGIVLAISGIYARVKKQKLPMLWKKEDEEEEEEEEERPRGRSH